MNLLNGVFGKCSAFSKVQQESSNKSVKREGRSMDTSTHLKSSSSNPSLEERRSFRVVTEKYSSSSEREMSLNSEEVKSLERPMLSTDSPLIPQGHHFMKPKVLKPQGKSNFSFLNNCKLNSMNNFGINSSFYWMKYQMMMGSNLVNLSNQNPTSLAESSAKSVNSETDLENYHTQMIGKLTFSERKAKVDRYLQKKRRKSKMVRYECRKRLAQKRLRYQGRFISDSEAEKLGKKLVFNPNNPLVPKPIFHTFKDTDRWKKRWASRLASMDSLESKHSTHSVFKPETEMLLNTSTPVMKSNQSNTGENDSMEVDFS